ncbi:uncharacterized protein LOC112681985 isoform X2 [Sipha flava]|uniref:Uncharacterized protein LOC112681985 isoform X2 n=1 Tax=Sipha flava TaxID=143950 RepID=A0A8B8FCM6_9HEMI|nr:uncharacterized protein LOC112681985 isoform X2 [Sipha flava]
MTFSDAFRFIEEGTNNLSIRHANRIQNKRMWKSLRKHILTRREKCKQAEANAEVLRKVKYLEQQKIQENKLSLAQINGRLSELRDKRDELEEEKQALLNQANASNNNVSSSPEVEAKCEQFDSNILATNNIIRSTVSDAISVRQQQIILSNNTQSYVIPPTINNLSTLERNSVVVRNIFNGE